MGDERDGALILDEEQIRRALARIAHEILERNGGGSDLLLVGVRPRGVDRAGRLAERLQAFEGAAVPVLELDPRPYRDDRSRGAAAGPSFSGEVSGKRIILLDDVLYTGRT